MEVRRAEDMIIIPQGKDFYYEPEDEGNIVIYSKNPTAWTPLSQILHYRELIREQLRKEQNFIIWGNRSTSNLTETGSGEETSSKADPE